MKRYKEDQGRLARMAAFWSITLLVLFGCNFLYGILLDYFESMSTPINGIRIPIVSVDLTGAFITTMVLFLIGALAVHRWQQRQKVVDLLIDTESELKKVTWPSSEEVINSSLVVIISVVLIGAFLALVDLVFARIMKVLLLGGA